MRKFRLLGVLLAIMLLLPMAALARDITPLVSTDWLQKNLENPRIVVLDVRKVEEYKAGHIPKAVNAFYGSWAIKRGELLNELPANDELFDIIGGAGIDANSLVVVVGKTAAVPDQFDMTRVAWTLKYAGVANVAILDGGQDKWVKDGKAISTDAVRAKAKAYRGRLNRGLFVNKDYVLNRLGKAVILDVRAPAFYEGKQKLPLCRRPAGSRAPSICPWVSSSPPRASTRIRRPWRRWRRRRWAPTRLRRSSPTAIRARPVPPGRSFCPTCSVIRM